MQSTAQNSDEQTMLDIMEMRGFKVHAYNDHPWELELPNGECHIITKASGYSEIQVAFVMFQQVNHHYP
jgi:hypothetical protein